MADKRQYLFTEISKRFDIGSFDKFNSAMDDKERKKLFFNSVSEKLDIGSFDKFDSATTTFTQPQIQQPPPIGNPPEFAVANPYEVRANRLPPNEVSNRYILEQAKNIQQAPQIGKEEILSIRDKNYNLTPTEIAFNKYLEDKEGFTTKNILSEYDKVTEPIKSFNINGKKRKIFNPLVALRGLAIPAHMVSGALENTISGYQYLTEPEDKELKSIQENFPKTLGTVPQERFDRVNKLEGEAKQGLIPKEYMIPVKNVLNQIGYGHFIPVLDLLSKPLTQLQYTTAIGLIKILSAAMEGYFVKGVISGTTKNLIGEAVKLAGLQMATEVVPQAGEVAFSPVTTGLKALGVEPERELTKSLAVLGDLSGSVGIMYGVGKAQNKYREMRDRSRDLELNKPVEFDYTEVDRILNKYKEELPATVDVEGNKIGGEFIQPQEESKKTFYNPQVEANKKAYEEFKQFESEIVETPKPTVENVIKTPKAEVGRSNLSINELQKRGVDISEYTNALKELDDYTKTIDKTNPYKTKEQIELEEKVEDAISNTLKRGNDLEGIDFVEQSLSPTQEVIKQTEPVKQIYTPEQEKITKEGISKEKSTFKGRDVGGKLIDFKSKHLDFWGNTIKVAQKVIEKNKGLPELEQQASELVRKKEISGGKMTLASARSKILKDRSKVELSDSDISEIVKELKENNLIPEGFEITQDNIVTYQEGKYKSSVPINQFFHMMGKVKGLSTKLAIGGLGLTGAIGYSQLDEDDKDKALGLAATLPLMGRLAKGKEKTIKLKGEEVSVKDIYPEVTEGFYSPIEKKLLNSKFENKSSGGWLQELGKGDETTFTGLKEFLESKKPNEQVKKAELQQYLKDNRIQVVEVVKGDEHARNYEITEEPPARLGIDRHEALEILEKAGSIDNPRLPKFLQKRYGDKSDDILDYLQNYARDIGEYSKDTKFQQYQLEGKKSNYKEVLVTLTKKELKPIPERQNEISQKLYGKDFYDLEDPYQRGNVSNKISDQHSQNMFKTTHFNEPNILVHLRMNTRVDAEGKKVLFLEEEQSDWGQKGKKEGFAKGTKFDQKRYDELRDKYEQGVKEIKAEGKEPKQGGFTNYDQVLLDNKKLSQTEITEFQDQTNAKYKTESGIPQSPFVTETSAWTKLGLKVALKEAVKQGADKIAWTTGEQQNARYDLSKQVDELFYDRGENGGTLIGYKDGALVIDKKNVSPEKLPDYIGKDAAEKITNDKRFSNYENTGRGKLVGNDLKVGGKGMKGFYGSPKEGSLGIVGDVAKSLFKQEPKVTNIQIRDESMADGVGKNFTTKADAEKYAKENNLVGYRIEPTIFNNKFRITTAVEKSQQHSIDITPEMREQVKKGLPLFEIATATGLGLGALAYNKLDDEDKKKVESILKSGVGALAIGGVLMSKGDRKIATDIIKKLGDKRPIEELNKLSDKEIIDNLRNTKEGLTNKPIQPEAQPQIKEEPIIGKNPSTTKGYNTRTIHPEIVDKVSQVLESMRLEFNDYRRESIDNPATRAKAIKIAETMSIENLSLLKRGDIKSAEESLAYHIVAQQNIRDVVEKAISAKTEPEKISAEEDIIKAIALYGKVRALYTEAARTTQSGIIKISGLSLESVKYLKEYMNTLNPNNGRIVGELLGEITYKLSLEQIDGLKIAIEELANRYEKPRELREGETGEDLLKKILADEKIDFTPENVKKLKKALGRIKNKKATKAITELLIEHNKNPKAFDKFSYWFYNSILSNPITDVVNITGNTFNLAFEIMPDLLSPDAVKRKRVMRNIKTGYTKGIVEAKKIYNSESNEQSKFMEEMSFERRYDFHPKSKLGKAGRALLPTTRLLMEDVVFKSVAREVELSELKHKYKDLFEDRLDEIDSMIEKELDASTKGESIFNPSKLSDIQKEKVSEIIKDVNEFERYLVFQSELGKFGKGAQAISNSNVVAKLILPFVRIGINLGKVSYGASPLGFTKLFGEKGRMLSEGKREKVIRRAQLGTLFYSALGVGLASGVIKVTGKLSRDKDQNEILNNLGYKPNHIYFGGYGFNYMNISPFGYFLSLIGNASDEYKYGKAEEDIQNKFGNAVLASVESISDQGFLQGVSKLTQAVRYRDGSYFEAFEVGLLPNISSLPKDVRDLIKGEKYLYEKEGFVDRIKYKIGMDDGLIPKYDIWGEKSKNVYNRLPIPITKLDSKGKELDLWLLNNKLNVPKPSKNTLLGDREMTTREYSEYTRLVGLDLRKRLTDLLPELKELDREGAQEMITKESKNIKDEIKEIMQE